MIRVREIVMCLVMTLPIAGRTETITLDRLESILGVSERKSIQYQESRDSPWLERMQHSYGTMHTMPSFLEKRVKFPQHEVWRLYSDRIVRLASADDDHQEIVFGESAQIAVFTNAFRYIVAGQIRKLEPDFHLHLTGNESDWTVKLKPRSSGVQQYLESIEARGSKAELLQLIILEPGGDRTTTKFIDLGN